MAGIIFLIGPVVGAVWNDIGWRKWKKKTDAHVDYLYKTGRDALVELIRIKEQKEKEEDIDLDEYYEEVKNS